MYLEMTIDRGWRKRVDDKKGRSFSPRGGHGGNGTRKDGPVDEGNGLYRRKRRRRMRGRVGCRPGIKSKYLRVPDFKSIGLTYK